MAALPAAMTDIQVVVGQAASKVRELGVLGQKIGAAWQIEALPVEMIDHLRPAHQQTAFFGWMKRIPADLGLAVVADLSDNPGRIELKLVS